MYDREQLRLLYVTEQTPMMLKHVNGSDFRNQQLAIVVIVGSAAAAAARHADSLAHQPIRENVDWMQIAVGVNVERLMKPANEREFLAAAMKYHNASRMSEEERHLFELGSIQAVDPSVSFTRDTLPPPLCSVRAMTEEGARGETGNDVAAMKEMCVWTDEPSMVALM